MSNLLKIVFKICIFCSMFIAYFSNTVFSEVKIQIENTIEGTPFAVMFYGEDEKEMFLAITCKSYGYKSKNAYVLIEKEALSELNVADKFEKKEVQLTVESDNKYNAASFKKYDAEFESYNDRYHGFKILDNDKLIRDTIQSIKNGKQIYRIYLKIGDTENNKLYSQEIAVILPLVEMNNRRNLVTEILTNAC